MRLYVLFALASYTITVVMLNFAQQSYQGRKNTARRIELDAAREKFESAFTRRVESAEADGVEDGAGAVETDVSAGN